MLHATDAASHRRTTRNAKADAAHSSRAASSQRENARAVDSCCSRAIADTAAKRTAPRADCSLRKHSHTRR